MKKQPTISKTFLLFLITAILFWFLIKLSKKYIITETFPIVYTHISQDKILQKEPIQEIRLTISGTGFNLFTSKLQKKTIQLNARLIERKSGNNYVLPLSNQQLYIQNQLPKGIQIKSIITPPISLELGQLTSKKVPVVIQYTTQFKPGFNLVDAIVVHPDSIVVTGPKLIVDTLTELSTEKVTFTNIANDIVKEVSVLLPNEELKTITKKVLLKGQVEKYTEGSFVIPFTIINVPLNTKINTFPKRVKVVFKVSLKDFNTVKESMFTVRCSFQHSIDNKLTYLVPEVITTSNVVKNIKVIPNKIDYLIQQ